MKNIVLGILAHVDAGKTTLSEAILYSTGKLRNLGRVDNGDTLLDSDEIERKRGITVFSKQAEFQIDDTNYTILDTPGHVDFSAEMERCLQVAASQNDDMLYLSRAPIPRSKKDEKVAYKRHLGLYGLSREALLFYSGTERGYLESIEDVEMLRFLENGYRIKIVEVSSQSIGVDLEEDIAKVEAVLNKRRA